MAINEQQINAVVDRLVKQLSSKSPFATPTYQPHTLLGCFKNVEAAIKAAEHAYFEYKNVPVKQRKLIIKTIRKHCKKHIEALARMAVEETGLGRVKDKIIKNELATFKTPGVEDLEPIAFTGDDGLTLIEHAPYGVIGSITPCTNSSETVISNSIAMIAGGNSVVFNPHPSAKKTSAQTVHLLNQAILSAGGPANLVTTILNPTIESAQALMHHPKTRLLVVTGGPAVVKVAMKSGKKVIAAGPGNPPVVVDETADLEKAARDIVMSAGMDNNIICLIEKNIIVVDSVADEFKKLLVKYGAVELGAYQAKQLEKIIIDGDHPNKKFVGKNIQVILEEIGLQADDSKRIAIAEVTKNHPFAVIELLLPVIPFIRAHDFEEAMAIAYELEGGRFHTAAIHSKNIDHLHKMAVK